MRYRYFKFRHPSEPSLIKLEPIIPVTLRYENAQRVVYAVVDSGADSCMFHSSVARTLGIDLKSGKPDIVKGLSLDVIPAYAHTILLGLKGEPFVEIEVLFLELALIPDGGLLGQEGFFDQFSVTFQRWQDAIHITKRQGWKSR